MEKDLLEYIVGLINDGEVGEAYKEFREYHGIVNRFVCGNCLNTVNYTEDFICPKSCRDMVNNSSIALKYVGFGFII